MSHSRSDCSSPSSLSGCGSKTESTEDLWSEDRYLPESYLPSPDYFVSAVQPAEDNNGPNHNGGSGGGGGGGGNSMASSGAAAAVEGKREMDETWYGVFKIILVELGDFLNNIFFT